MLSLPFDKQQEMRDQSNLLYKIVTNYIKLYEEPQFDEENNYKKEETSDENINLKLELPLKEGLLKINIGIPIIFVVNKSEVVLQSNERRRFEEDSEFILKHIRSLALSCILYPLY